MKGHTLTVHKISWIEFEFLRRMGSSITVSLVSSLTGQDSAALLHEKSNIVLFGKIQSNWRPKGPIPLNYFSQFNPIYVEIYGQTSASIKNL